MMLRCSKQRNAAARRKTLAQPGGIGIGGIVYRAIGTSAGGQRST